MSWTYVYFTLLWAIVRIRVTRDSWKRYMAILDLDRWHHCLGRTGLRLPARRALLHAVRRWDDAMAAQLLGDMRDRRALRTLERVVAKQGIDSDLREKAALALQDIAPEKYGPRETPRQKYTVQYVQSTPPPSSRAPSTAAHDTFPVETPATSEAVSTSAAADETGADDEQLARRLTTASHEKDREKVRAIGRTLDARGGIEKMKEVYYRADDLGADGRWIEFHWSGIGDWDG